MAQKWNSVPLWRWHLNRIGSSDITVIRSVTNWNERNFNFYWFLVDNFDDDVNDRERLNWLSWLSCSPVQNLGSSLKSPHWSMPSQYLSSGRHNPLPLHANSDILHDRTRMMRFNKIMPQAPTLSRRMMIWKIAKLLLCVVAGCVRARHAIISW